MLICVCVLTFPHGWCRVDLCTQLLLLGPLCLIVAQNESATAQLLDNPTHKFHVREACASGAERKREGGVAILSGATCSQVEAVSSWELAAKTPGQLRPRATAVFT